MFIVDYLERREEDGFISAIDDLVINVVEAYENAGSHQEEIWIIAEPIARFLQEPGTGLEISKVEWSKGSAIGEVTPTGLTIEGEITNTIGIARTIPRLRAVVLDANGAEIAQINEPPTKRLPPGGTARFKIDIECTANDAANPSVSFMI